MNPQRLPVFTLSEWEYKLLHSSIANQVCTDGRWRGGQSVASPSDIVITEQRRREIQARVNVGRSVAADVFCFGIGEPELPYCTKVGGIPFRPSNSPWPVDSDGGPMTFVAQLCFCESEDLFSGLPGDVLLFFASDYDICPSDRKRKTHFEWQNLNAGQLLTPDAVPNTQWRVPALYGCRYRTADYPDEAAVNAARSYCHGGWGSWWNIFCWEGTKIGGVPMWIQNSEIPSEVEFPGRFLAAIGTCTPTCDIEFPWINQQAPMTFKESQSSNFLEWDDSGMIYLSLDSNNEVHWTLQYY